MAAWKPLLFGFGGLGADDSALNPGLRFDRSLSQAADPYPSVSRRSERLPFIQREGAFEYVVDAGHRLFERAELDDVVLHPPIQRFLRRWESGDPAVYLGSLWAP